MIDPQIREDLKAFLDGELPEVRAAEVEAAIAANPELEDEMKFYQSLSLGIRELASPVEVHGRAEAIERFKTNNTAPFSWNRFFGLIAVVFAVGLLSAILYPVFAKAKVGGGPMSELKAARAKSEAAQAPDSRPMGSDSSATDSAMLAPGSRPLSKGESTTGGTTGSLEGSANAPSESGQSQFQNQDGIASAPTTRTLSKKGQRMVIRNAYVQIRVPETQPALDSLTSKTEKLGGYVASSTLDGDPKIQLSAELELKIPSKNYDTFMADLRKMGDVLSTNSQGDDVTTAYADLQAKVRVMKAERESLTKMLKSMSSMEEVVSLRERIMRLQAEIDGLEAQAITLKNQSDLATIRVLLTEPKKEREELVQSTIPPADPFATTWNGSVAGMVGALQVIGKLGIIIVVYAPIWIPITVLVWYLYRNRRRFA